MGPRFYTQFVSNVRQLFAADDFRRGHFQMHFFLGALRIKGDICVQNFHLGRYIVGYTVRSLVLR